MHKNLAIFPAYLYGLHTKKWLCLPRQTDEVPFVKMTKVVVQNDEKCRLVLQIAGFAVKISVARDPKTDKNRQKPTEFYILPRQTRNEVKKSMKKLFFECGQGMKNFATDKLAQQTAQANENAQFIIYTAGCDPETLFEHSRIFRYSDFMFYGDQMKLFSANGHIKAYEFPLWNGVMYRSAQWYEIINKPNSHAAGRGSYLRMRDFLEMGFSLSTFLEKCEHSENLRSLSTSRFLHAFEHSEQMRIENFSSESLKSNGVLGDIYENSLRLLFSDWLVVNDDSEIDNLLYNKVHQGANEHDIELEFSDTEYNELMSIFAENGVI